MSFLRYVPEYSWRCFKHIDFILGGLIATVVWYLVAEPIGLTNYKSRIAVLLITITCALASYAVFREERIMRSKREQSLQFRATLGALSVNYPDPGPDKESLMAHVTWEIWTNETIYTKYIGLNVIYVYDRPWWQFWKKTRFPQTGIPIKGAQSTEYRVQLPTNQYQPFTGEADFEYIADRESSSDPHWILELVLITGMPPGRYSAPVTILDPAERLRRESNPPL